MLSLVVVFDLDDRCIILGMTRLPGIVRDDANFDELAKSEAVVRHELVDHVLLQIFPAAIDELEDVVYLVIT